MTSIGSPAAPQVRLERFAFELVGCVVVPDEDRSRLNNGALPGGTSMRRTGFPGFLNPDLDGWRGRCDILVQPLADVAHKAIAIFEQLKVVVEAGDDACAVFHANEQGAAFGIPEVGDTGPAPHPTARCPSAWCGC